MVMDKTHEEIIKLVLIHASLQIMKKQFAFYQSECNRQVPSSSLALPGFADKNKVASPNLHDLCLLLHRCCFLEERLLVSCTNNLSLKILLSDGHEMDENVIVMLESHRLFDPVYSPDDVRHFNTSVTFDLRNHYFLKANLSIVQLCTIDIRLLYNPNCRKNCR